MRISTVWEGAGGIGGLFERMFAPGVLRAVSADELKRLDAYAPELLFSPVGCGSGLARWGTRRMTGSSRSVLSW